MGDNTKKFLPVNSRVLVLRWLFQYHGCCFLGGRPSIARQPLGCQMTPPSSQGALAESHTHTVLKYVRHLALHWPHEHVLPPFPLPEDSNWISLLGVFWKPLDPGLERSRCHPSWGV